MYASGIDGYSTARRADSESARLRASIRPESSDAAGLVVADETTRPAGPKTGEVYSTRLGGVKAREADARTNATGENPSVYRGFSLAGRHGAADRPSPGTGAPRPMEPDCTLYFPEQAGEPLTRLPGSGIRGPGSELESMARGQPGRPPPRIPNPETGATHASISRRKSRVAPRQAMRPTGKARRGTMQAACDPGETQADGMQRLSHATGLSPRAARGSVAHAAGSVTGSTS